MVLSILTMSVGLLMSIIGMVMAVRNKLKIESLENISFVTMLHCFRVRSS